MSEEDYYQVRQKMAEKRGNRFYGDGGTIHSTEVLNVETNAEGVVISVWFRCQPLPFDQTIVGEYRAAEMKKMYDSYKTELHGVEVRDVK